jgi:hypothetical protein
MNASERKDEYLENIFRENDKSAILFDETSVERKLGIFKEEHKNLIGVFQEQNREVKFNFENVFC